MYIYNYVLVLCLFLMACNGNAKKTQAETENKPETEVMKSADSNTAPAEQIDTAPASKKDTVVVSNMEELVEKANSNKVIILKKGVYNLNKDFVYLVTKAERKIIDKTKVETRSIGGQLHISGMNNFELIGEKGVSFNSGSQVAVPLFILGCKDVKISNLTVQKDVAGSSDLLYVSNCRNVVIEKCKFNKGGYYGLYTNLVENVKVNNCEITNCTGGAIRVNESKGLEFNNTTISNNFFKIAMITLYGTGSFASFNGVNIVDNVRNEKEAFAQSNQIFSPRANVVRLNNCVIRNNKGYDLLGLGPNSITRTEIDGVSMQ